MRITMQDPSAVAVGSARCDRRNHRKPLSFLRTDRADRGSRKSGETAKLVVIAFVSVLCGATTGAGMATFGREKESYFRDFLKLKRAIPSHDTFSTVFRMIDPKALDAAFGKVLADVTALLREGDMIAIDGKALRGARGKGESARTRMMVSAYGARLPPTALAPIRRPPHRRNLLRQPPRAPYAAVERHRRRQPPGWLCPKRPRRASHAGFQPSRDMRDPQAQSRWPGAIFLRGEFFVDKNRVSA